VSNGITWLGRYGTWALAPTRTTAYSSKNTPAPTSASTGWKLNRRSVSRLGKVGVTAMGHSDVRSDDDMAP
jgi:hypothetical protein